MSRGSHKMKIVSSSPNGRGISSQTELHPTTLTPFQQINKRVLLVPNKRLLSWYLITLKFRERMYARQKGLPILSPKSGLYWQPQQQQFAPLGVLVNRNAENHEIESHPPQDDWAITINEIEEELGAPSQGNAAVSWKEVSIYRIPDHLKDQLRDPSRSKAYTPRVVSLGPYHHGMTRLQKMERHKRRILQHALNRMNIDKSLFIDSMKKHEGRARDYYEGPLDQLNSNQFVAMMLLDGFFIIEILRGFKKGFKNLGYDTADPIFSRKGTLCSIRLDMIMLENQIPLFVLNELRRLQLINKPGGKSGVVKPAVKFFRTLIPSKDKHFLTSLSDQHALHFLNVLREDFLHGFSEDASKFIKSKKLNYCATALRDAGVKFRVGDNNKLWNITFDDKGILSIPRIRIDGGFKSLFFNLIAFEQCRFHPKEHHITSYVAFLDDLIDSPEDVRYLKNHRIIDHMLGSDSEVADLINCLLHGVLFHNEPGYLSPQSSKIHKYYKKKWHNWRAILKEKYFNNPWAIISFVAGVLLLIMTAAQTFFGFYSYYWPTN